MLGTYEKNDAGNLLDFFFARLWSSKLTKDVTVVLFLTLDMLLCTQYCFFLARMLASIVVSFLST